MSVRAVARGAIVSIAAALVFAVPAQANDDAHKIAEKFAGEADGAGTRGRQEEGRRAQGGGGQEACDRTQGHHTPRAGCRAGEAATQREAERKAEAARKRRPSERRKPRARPPRPSAARPPKRRRRRAAPWSSAAPTNPRCSPGRAAKPMRCASAEEEARLTEEARRLIEQAEMERAKAEELLAERRRCYKTRRPSRRRPSRRSPSARNRPTTSSWLVNAPRMPGGSPRS